ncbi:hypothetical protein FACS189414_3140 [Bacteroidia bacterium]|nr:hypothetical protein FACS189414_3140 [Bacteroidia bacterium]
MIIGKGILHPDFEKINKSAGGIFRTYFNWNTTYGKLMYYSVLIYWFLSLLFIICMTNCNIGRQGRTDNIDMVEISQTNRLRVGDSIISFCGLTDSNLDFDMASLSRDALFIYFSNNNGTCLLNEEILNHNTGKLAKDKNVDVLFISDMKIANLYGIEYTAPPERKMKHPVLFVVDSEKKIKRIFKNAATENIIDLLNEY